jgi:hypothetical protein
MLKIITLKANFKDKDPTIQSFIQDILQNSDQATWLIMADYLDL